MFDSKKSIDGWKDNPALPDGMIYEGVADYNNQPQKFKGETGAQSTIIPSLDAFFGIEHAENPLKIHLDEMRNYMPPQHRQFLEAVEQGPSIRTIIKKSVDPDLKNLYNDCLTLITHFRKTHIGYASQYIQKQAQKKTQPTPPKSAPAAPPSWTIYKNTSKKSNSS